MAPTVEAAPELVDVTGIRHHPVLFTVSDVASVVIVQERKLHVLLYVVGSAEMSDLHVTTSIVSTTVDSASPESRE